MTARIPGGIPEQTVSFPTQERADTAPFRWKTRTFPGKNRLISVHNCPQTGPLWIALWKSQGRKAAGGRRPMSGCVPRSRRGAFGSPASSFVKRCPPAPHEKFRMARSGLAHCPRHAGTRWPSGAAGPSAPVQRAVVVLCLCSAALRRLAGRGGRPLRLSVPLRPSGFSLPRRCRGSPVWGRVRVRGCLLAAGPGCVSGRGQVAVRLALRVLACFRGRCSFWPSAVRRVPASPSIWPPLGFRGFAAPPPVRSVGPSFARSPHCTTASRGFGARSGACPGWSARAPSPGFARALRP